jgi:exosome complex component RRP40
MFFFFIIVRHLSYEAAIGMNGMIWFKGSSVKESIVIRNALLNSERLNEFQIEAMIELLVQKMREL